MTIQEMVVLFRKKGVPEYYYELGGLGSGECYGIERTNEGWEIYYSERGNKSVLHRFHDEDEAVSKMIEYIDEAMRRDFGKSVVD